MSRFSQRESKNQRNRSRSPEREGQSPRIHRELRTLECMLRIYCHGHHHSRQTNLCPECEELLRYANARLAACPWQERKTTCAQCSIHCYAPEHRDQIRRVMRYSGPRMLYTHPLFALMHLYDRVIRPRLPEGIS